MVSPSYFPSRMLEFEEFDGLKVSFFLIRLIKQGLSRIPSIATVRNAQHSSRQKVLVWIGRYGLMVIKLELRVDRIICRNETIYIA